MQKFQLLMIITPPINIALDLLLQREPFCDDAKIIDSEF